MYARLVRLRIRDNEVERAASIFELQALPQLKQQLGFVAAALLVQPPATGAAIMIMWRERWHSERLERDGFYREQIAKFDSVFAAPPEAELYEVRVWTGYGPGAEERR